MQDGAFQRSSNAEWLVLVAGDAEGDDDKKKRQTRGGKARVKLPVVEEKKKPGTIKLSIASRGKKKYVTVITGLGSHGEAQNVIYSCLKDMMVCIS